MSRDDLKKDTLCDRWIDHVTAATEASLPFEFKLHMKTCETCREEWYGLRIVWEALALDAEHQDVPDGLKSEVMNAIFGEEAGENSGANFGSEPGPVSNAAYDQARLVTLEPKRISWNRRGFVLVSACCIFLLAGWGVWTFGPSVWNPSPVAGPVSAQSVLKEWSLSATLPAMPEAKGSIQLLREGDQQKVVVRTDGLEPTVGDQAYQVWLLHNGNRYNCGTFRVDRNGKGSMVYDLKRPDIQIDGFGITLEPDALGTSPRGTKVLGTAQQS